MQFRRRSVLGDSIRSAHHVIVCWYCLCRILRGSLCLNVNEESSLFLRTLRANKLVCNDVFLTCFPPCDVQFYARFAVPVCSLFKVRFWCHFNVNSCVKSLLFRRLFVSFSEPLLRYSCSQLNGIFQALFLYVFHQETLAFNARSHSVHNLASHYGIRGTQRATGVPTVYEVRMATNVTTQEKVSASQTGLSHDDIREEDSLSNVTSTTRRHMVHARHSLKLEQRPRVWHSKNDKRNALF